MTLPRAWLGSDGVAEIFMAKNTGEGFRKGAVDNRIQVHNPRNDSWTKRDSGTGHFIDQKQSPGPFKGVTRENSPPKK